MAEDDSDVQLLLTDQVIDSASVCVICFCAVIRRASVSVSLSAAMAKLTLSRSLVVVVTRHR